MQTYEKAVEDYEHELQTTGRSAETGMNGHLTTDHNDQSHRPSQSSVMDDLEDAQSRYQALVATSSDLLSKLDSAVLRCGQYDQLTDEVGRTLPAVESLVDQCASSGLADTDSGLQRQLDLVTTAANRVAGLGKVVTELERAGMTTVQALEDLDLTDSDRVHTIRQDVETTKSRLNAIQLSTGEQQRLVNATFAQLQDPSHNLAVLLNWV